MTLCDECKEYNQPLCKLTQTEVQSIDVQHCQLQKPLEVKKE